MTTRISRRTLLRGLGVGLSLPYLEIMRGSALARQSQSSSPVRLIWLHTESGMWMPSYKPTGTGLKFELSPTLKSLAPFRDQLSVLTGLYHEHAFRRNPQTGRHAQDTICHLTGADLGGTPGVAVKNTISVDQLAAEHLGEKTRHPVLNLSPARGGYLAFSASGAGVPHEWDPQTVFQQLFAEGTVEAKQLAAQRMHAKQSILDAVRESTAELNARLGARDRQHLDEYLTNVREVERRLQVTRRWAALPPAPLPAGVKPPANVAENDRPQRIRLLLDMLVLALQTDQTRLATMQLGFMSCAYPAEGFPDTYHNYTHHDNLPQKQAAMAGVDRLRIGHLAYFLEKLNGIREGEQTLLHNCVVHYGSGMGSWHESTDIANLVVGRGGGRLPVVGHVDYGGAPLSNLFVTQLQLAGAPVKSFADSTGPLRHLEPLG